MYLLENEQEKITAANRKLEKRVKERTAQLEMTNTELREEIEERKRVEQNRETGLRLISVKHVCFKGTSMPEFTKLHSHIVALDFFNDSLFIHKRYF